MKAWGYGEGYQHAHEFEDAMSTWSACPRRSQEGSGTIRPNAASRNGSANVSPNSANPGGSPMTFRTLETGVPRRALLLMPVAYFGLDAIFNRKEHAIPDPPGDGSKLVLSDAEWKQRLTP